MSDVVRPFAQTPSADRHVPTERAELLRKELYEAALAGDGLTLLTGGSGQGKTHHAVLLSVDAEDRLTPVLLPSGAISTRRGMFQQVLAHFGREYAGLSEGECRLSLLEAAREVCDAGRPVLLIVDEADRSSDRLLEEFRALQNFVREGCPLIRTVLIGECAFEERLADGRLDAVNQRIACVTSLSPMGAGESAEYIAGRVEAVGAVPEELFTPDAIAEIGRAADGVPRALNYLAEKTIQLSDGVATTDDVRSALSQLASLPIAWNVPLADSIDVEGLLSELAPHETDPASASALLEPLDGAVVEIGTDHRVATGEETTVDESADNADIEDPAPVVQEQLFGDESGEAEPETLDSIDDGLAAASPSEAAPSRDVLDAWDDVLPDLPAEFGEGRFSVVGSAPEEIPRTSPDRSVVGRTTADELIEAVLPLVQTDPTDADVAALEKVVAEMNDPGEEPDLVSAVAEDAMSAVEVEMASATSSGPTWPSERTAVIEPPAPEDAVREVAEVAASAEPDVSRREGLFTRLRRRQLES